MASRMMHLAVTHSLAESCDVKDRERFFLGSVIPDSAPKAVSHYYKYFDSGRRKTYDLPAFREHYSDFLGDSLYLGYYMHLIQDLVFRDHLYHTVGYVPTNEKVVQLHRDYELLNRYICKKYRIESLPAVPVDIGSELIVKELSLDVRGFIRDMSRDLTEQPQGEPVFYTASVAEEYFSRALAACRTELSALDGKGEHTDEKRFSWLRHD